VKAGHVDRLAERQIEHSADQGQQGPARRSEQHDREQDAEDSERYRVHVAGARMASQALPAPRVFDPRFIRRTVAARLTN
jgi:hypothetical protein